MDWEYLLDDRNESLLNNGNKNIFNKYLKGNLFTVTELRDFLIMFGIKFNIHRFDEEKYRRDEGGKYTFICDFTCFTFNEFHLGFKMKDDKILITHYLYNIQDVDDIW